MLSSILSKKPYTGIISFILVLFTMPLGHSAMILMEKGFGHEYVFHAAIALGLFGLTLLVIGVVAKNKTFSTFMGLFSGLFVWTGWVEFSFVYYAKRFEVKGLIENGEMVTKPEYLIMPSSIGFLGVLFLIYVLGNNSNCPFFIWFQKRLRIFSKIKEIPTEKNPAVVTFAEFIAILWTFYLLLLFAYDKNFFGDRHPVTYIIAFGSLFWSLYLFMRLMTFNQFAYSLRYSIPTVIIFWNFVEILGRWNLMKEIWLEPKQYSLEMGLLLLIFTLVTSYSIFLGFKPKKNLQ